MPIEAPTVGMLGTVAGLSLIVTIVTEVVLRAVNPTAAWKDRFGPILALGIGIAFSVAGALFTGAPDVLTAVLLGVIVGGGGMGIHDTVDSVTSP